MEFGCVPAVCVDLVGGVLEEDLDERVAAVAGCAEDGVGGRGHGDGDG